LEARTTAIVCAACALLLPACGSAKKQDEDERAGNYELELVKASFPEKQKLAKRSNLVIRVRNAGAQTAPNVAVTIKGLSERRKNLELADPERPIFVINGQPVEIGGLPESREDAPRGCDTAYVSTWACGPLPAGEERAFRFSVTAVEAGKFDISYRVAAGLDRKARAVASGGTPLSGNFKGVVSDAAPDSRVSDEDGTSIVKVDKNGKTVTIIKKNGKTAVVEKP
jgi:hypothetical protein